MPITVTIPVLDRTSANFKLALDEFFGTTFPAFAGQANALAADLNEKHQTATTAAGTATTKAGEASESAEVAEGAASTATTQASQASESAEVATGAASTASSAAGTAAEKAAAAAEKAAAAAESAEAAVALVAAIAGGPVVSVNGKPGPTPNLVATDIAAAATQIEMEAGSEAGMRSMSPLRVAQAIEARAKSGISTVGSVITTSATLTAASPGYQPVAMTAIGQSVTLPDATTLTVGGPKFILDNTKGGYPAGIRDAAGTLVMAVAAGGEALVALRDNSTTAGIWSVTGMNLEPGLITIDNTFSSTYSSTVLAPFVALDDNTSIHFAALASGFAAFVVDNMGKAVGTPVTVSNESGYAPCIAFRITPTTAIVFYGYSGGSGLIGKVVVLTLSGASPEYSISVGASATSSSTFSHPWGGEDFIGIPRIAQLSPTLYVVVDAYGQVSCLAVSVSGATVNIGPFTSILGSNGVEGSGVVYPLTATTALALYNNGTALSAAVISVSGTTCTVGTSVTVATLQSTAYFPCSAKLSATKVLCAYSTEQNGPSAKISVLTISGTSIAVGPRLTIESSMGGVDTTVLGYTSNSATRYNPHLWPIGPNTAGLWYVDTGGVSRAVILSESEGVITPGGVMYGSISSGADAGAGSILPQGTSEFCSLMRSSSIGNGVSGSAAYLPILSTCKITGTTITQGASRPAGPSIIATYDGRYAQSTRFSTGKYIITNAASGASLASSGFLVFSSNGDALNILGTISAPVAVFGSAVPCKNIAVSSNRAVVLGATQNGSTVGRTTYQLRLINVEIAA